MLKKPDLQILPMTVPFSTAHESFCWKVTYGLHCNLFNSLLRTLFIYVLMCVCIWFCFSSSNILIVPLDGCHILSLFQWFILERLCYCPGGVAQMVGASFHTPKGCGFDFQSGHITRLLVWSLVRAHMGGNGLISVSCQCFSVSLCFLLSLSLSLPLSL